MGEWLAQLSLDVKTVLFQPRLRADDRRLRAAELLAPEILAEQQRNRAMEMVRYAFDNCAFYRDRYTAEGVHRRDLFDPAVFDQLPVVEKTDLRENPTAFRVPDLPERRRLPSSTGGSTGEPLTLFHDRLAPTAAMWWRVYRWWGLQPAVNTAFIQRERRSPQARMREQLQWWPTSHIFLDARDMTTGSMAAFVREWNRHRPTLLNGYVGGVHEFADFVQRTGATLARPRAIGVTAAPIPPSQREFIQGVFGAPVYDQYRSAEVPWIAAECAVRGGLHVLSDLRVVEIVDGSDPVPPGVEGDVVVTDLCNRVLPLIRYRLGDRSTLMAGRCTCSLPFPRIAPIQGRISDVLRLPGGQRISGGLTGLFNHRPDAVRQFQIRQNADYSITLRCVIGAAADSRSVIEHAAGELAAIVRHEVPVGVEYVPEIRHDRGKARVVLSELPT